MMTYSIIEELQNFDAFNWSKWWALDEFLSICLLPPWKSYIRLLLPSLKTRRNYCVWSLSIQWKYKGHSTVSRVRRGVRPPLVPTRFTPHSMSQLYICTHKVKRGLRRLKAMGRNSLHSTHVISIYRLFDESVCYTYFIYSTFYSGNWCTVSECFTSLQIFWNLLTMKAYFVN